MRVSFGSFAVLAISAVFAGKVAAADLFQLTGTNGEGASVNVTISDTLAEEIGATEIHTKVVSRGDAVSKVRGVELRKLLEKFDLKGENIHVSALDGYVMDIPADDVRSYPVVVGYAIDDKPLRVRDKGPAWIIYPVSDHPELDNADYEARSVWQVKTIDVGEK